MSASNLPAGHSEPRLAWLSSHQMSDKVLVHGIGFMDSLMGPVAIIERQDGRIEVIRLGGAYSLKMERRDE